MSGRQRSSEGAIRAPIGLASGLNYLENVVNPVHTDRLVSGLRLLALAELGFLAAGIGEALDAAVNLGFALSAVGFYLASTGFFGRTSHWGRLALGTFIVIVGTLPFFVAVLTPFDLDLYLASGLVFLLALGLGASGSVRAWRAGGLGGTARALVLGCFGGLALAGLLWTPLDLIAGNYYWTAGNVLCLVGGTLSLYALVRAAPAPAEPVPASKA